MLRTVYQQVPPKVEYSVTALGESLRAITDQLAGHVQMAAGFGN